MIFGKVWGDTSPLLMTPFVEVHRIQANEGYRCSWHKHLHRHNAFYVISGRIAIDVKKEYNLIDTTILAETEMTSVAPNEEHQFRALEDSIVLEIYYAEALVKDDIIRSDVGGLSE